ncbi:MAG: hypothetical protein ACPG1C_14240 [Alphaproteobacteria bacterium]
MDIVEKRPLDRFIPWLFVLGFFVVFAANGALIYYALGNFPGFAEGYHRPPVAEDTHD